MTAHEYVDLLFGQRKGFVATAFGRDPYRNERGKYAHREWQEVRFCWPDERDLLLRTVEKELATGDPVDVYVCPGLRVSDARHGLNGKHGTNMAPSSVLWADCDSEPDPAMLARLGVMVVDSGTPGHRHVYALLAEPVPVVTHRVLNESLAASLGADAKYSDEVLLRMPGTRNWKPTVPPAGVQPGPPAPVVML